MEIKLVLGIFSLVAMVVAFLYRNRLRYFEKYGYLGIFIISVIGNIAIFSPTAPLASVLGGSIYNPWIVSFVTALGAVVGEMASYSIGYVGENSIQDYTWYDKIKHFMELNGALTIFLVSAIPNPLFDLVGIIAGATNYPLRQFIIISFLGKWIKYGIFALAGHTLIKTSASK